MLDLGGSAGLIVILAVFVAVPLTALLTAAQSFYVAFSSFFVGMLFIYLAMTGLSFLLPFSLPFFEYAIASFGQGLLATFNEGAGLLFTMLIWLFISLLMGIGLCTIFLEDADEAVGPGFFLGLPIALCNCGDAMELGESWIPIIMRIVWLIAAFWFVVSLFQWIKGLVKGEFKLTWIGAKLVASLAGFVPIIIGVLFWMLCPSQDIIGIWSLVAIILTSVAIIVSKNLVQMLGGKFVDSSIEYESAFYLPLLIGATGLLLASGVFPQVEGVIVPDVLIDLGQNPLFRGIGAMVAPLLEAAGWVVLGLLSLIVDLMRLVGIPGLSSVDIAVESLAPDPLAGFFALVILLFVLGALMEYRINILMKKLTTKFA